MDYNFEDYYYDEDDVEIYEGGIRQLYDVACIGENNVMLYILEGEDSVLDMMNMVLQIKIECELKGNSEITYFDCDITNECKIFDIYNNKYKEIKLTS